MSAPQAQMPPSDTRSLATSLAPVLCDACEGQLSDISWFKADWQRGGAATATATFTPISSNPRPVIVKLPVVGRELLWTKRLQPDNGADDPDLVIPHLLQSGSELAGYDLAWLIIEKFRHGPLGLKWHDNHIPRIIDAAVRFHAATSQHPIDQEPRFEDWHALIATARENARLNELPEQQRWNTVLKSLTARLDDLVAEWRARPITQWIHGDLHIANAMSRHGMNKGNVSLIDLAEVHPGHWVEDAVYLERQFWARPERLAGHDPVKAMSKARKKLGLPVDANDAHLATIRRVLLAATAPDFLASEGHPVYLHSCLEHLEQGLAVV